MLVFEMNPEHGYATNDNPKWVLGDRRAEIRYPTTMAAAGKIRVVIRSRGSRLRDQQGRVRRLKGMAKSSIRTLESNNLPSGHGCGKGRV